MSQLTNKQIANRAYYARNAEKIKAQKRSAYRKTIKTKPTNLKPDIRNTIPKKPKPVTKLIAEKPKSVRKTITPEDRTKLEARRRIEDFQLAKELGVDDFL